MAFTLTNQHVLDPPPILEGICGYLCERGFTANIVSDELAGQVAVKVTLNIANKRYSCFFVLLGDSLVVQQNNVNAKRTGPEFPLSDPTILDKITTHLISWHGFIRQLALLADSCSNDAGRIDSNSSH